MEKYGLTFHQEMFCQYFTSPSEFFGNGTQSYLAAYGLDGNNPHHYSTAKCQASGLLTNRNIIKRITDLIELAGFNDQNVDKQLLLVIQQSADFNAKISAIREYNKLKQRITDRMEIRADIPVTTIRILPYTDKTNDNGGDTSNDTNASTSD